jgi:DNA-binding response OmpR family regulator
MEKILILEDSDSIRESVENYLKLNDYEAFSCASCAEAREALEQFIPNLAIIDISLPDGNGFFFSRDHLRGKNIPFLFLSSQNEESDRITGLELGALDYITKPFSLKELILRVKAILKRANPDGSSAVQKQKWVLGPDTIEYAEITHKLSLNGVDIHLTTMEWEIISTLILHEGAILSREQIQKNLHFVTGELSPRTIDSHIKNIRFKLHNPDWIVAVRSFGFRFAGESALA